MSEKALWAGRFKEGMAESTLRFTSSLDVDTALAFYDVMGSLAHVRMLKSQGILSKRESDLIIKGLIDIVDMMERDDLDIDDSLEDIHTNIEFKLTSLIGPDGGRLHTGRSRNDQVATDFKMYLRDMALEVVEGIDNLIMALMEVGDAYGNAILPGFTHMQHAQPVLLSQHLMAHSFRLSRDADRFVDCIGRMNKCPLGSAALAGTTYPIDRDATARMLAFDSPTENSMDSVSSRDYVAELLFCSSMASIDLSSICEELVLWSSQEFGFIEMDDRHTTGSSIMPQKKNPDIAELVRGRTGGIIGGLTSLMVTLKGLPLSYNRDLQEDKRPAMDSMTSLLDCLDMLADVIASMRVNEDRMLNATKGGFINATDLADYLVIKGIPFREAHGIVGEIVRRCIEMGIEIDDMPLKDLEASSKSIGSDVFDFISINQCVNLRKSKGGTSPDSTSVQMESIAEAINARGAFVEDLTQRIEGCWKGLIKPN